MFAWERHFARMQRDAERLRVPFPQDSEWLKTRLDRLIEKNEAWNATLRVVIVRNRGGEWLKLWEGPGIDREFDAIAFTGDVNRWSADAAWPGVRLGVIANARYAANEFAGVKYLAWSQNLTWFERAHEQGFDEVVLLNERGEVAECTSANIFAVNGLAVNGIQISTPPLASGCLAGVTRATLLEDVQIDGVRIAEKTLTLEDLESADELFITSTTRELLPVASIEGLHLRESHKPRESVRERLQKAFGEHVRAYISTRRAMPAVR